MTRRPTLLVLCGGPSPEHRISLLSAWNVVSAARAIFEVLVVGITRQGDWRLLAGGDFLVGAEAARTVDLNLEGSRAAWLTREDGVPGLRTEDSALHFVDVVFPVLHGAYGEDGTVQGLLEAHGVPYVGCGVAASAICMDKDLTKRLLSAAGIAVAPGFCLEVGDWEGRDVESLAVSLGLPLFVKPARLGSSIGIRKVEHLGDLPEALAWAFHFDTKVLVEAQVAGREVECAVLGNDRPQASLAGEVVPRKGFYSYEAKYDAADGADVLAPAPLPSERQAEIQALACKVYRILGCSGLARVDGFLTRDDRLIVNEVNTLPGFTAISLFPKLWACSGLSMTALVAHLVELALERHKQSCLARVCALQANVEAHPHRGEGRRGGAS